MRGFLPNSSKFLHTIIPMLVIRCFVINNDDNLPFTMFHVCHCASPQKMEKLEPFADRHLRLLLLLRWAKVRLGAAVYLCIAIYIYTYFENFWDLRSVSMLQCCTT